MDGWTDLRERGNLSFPLYLLNEPSAERAGKAQDSTSGALNSQSLISEGGKIF